MNQVKPSDKLEISELSSMFKTAVTADAFFWLHASHGNTFFPLKHKLSEFVILEIF